MIKGYHLIMILFYVYLNHYLDDYTRFSLPRLSSIESGSGERNDGGYLFWPQSNFSHNKAALL